MPRFRNHLPSSEQIGHHPTQRILGAYVKGIEQCFSSSTCQNIIRIYRDFVPILTELQCDEQKPTCSRCEGYGTPCSFLQTHPLKGTTPLAAAAQANSPNSLHNGSPLLRLASQPLPASFSLFDMELFYHWVTEASKSFTDFDNAAFQYGTVAVHFAFQHEFMMHELLALSALHLARIKPDEAVKYRYVADSHAAIGLGQFQSELINLTIENCHSCFLFSTTTFIHTWAAHDPSKPSSLFFIPSHLAGPDEPIKWVRLHRGSQEIMQKMWPVFRTGPLKWIFDPWLKLDESRGDPLTEGDKRNLSILAEAWSSSITVSVEHKEILFQTLETLKRIYSMLSFYPEISKLAVGISWLSSISDEFLLLVEDKMPEALLIVAYYAVVFKRIPETWWSEGKAENLLRTVLDELGPGWEPFTKWPIETVLNSPVEMVVGTQQPTPTESTN
jgi:hypothetical protein